MFYNVVLAAGRGSRFFKYSVPKPFLRVKRKNLLLRASECLPKKGKFIFVLRKSHQKYLSKIREKIKKSYSNSRFYFLSKITKGQASTLYTLKNKINHKSPIFVTSTDFCFKNKNHLFKKYSSKKFNIVFVCKPKKEMTKFPQYYGWVRVKKNGDIIKISCKKKIPGNSTNDKIILGAFYFTSFEYYLKYYKKLVKKKILVNKEYYIDMVMEIIRKKKKVKIINIDKFINWGTPYEYEKNKNKILS